MTPEQHYRAAEAALEASENAGHVNIAKLHIDRAHVHALLAGIPEAIAEAAPTEWEPVIPASPGLEAPTCTHPGCTRPQGHIGSHTGAHE